MRSIGFFHFVENHETPIEALRKELEIHRQDVANSLLVLPEAFNIGDYWRPRQESDFDPQILESLSTLATEFSCVFVAGLTVRETIDPQSPEPPYSSCYLIDGKSEARAFCRKFRSDRSNNYTPSEGREDLVATVDVDGMVVGSLICMDASLASEEP